MNPIPAISPDDQNVVEFSESPGRRLRVQRQSRGIEVERIAAQLHLRVAAVEALEQDRYQDLPGPVFVAGYLRNYARLLGLDPEPLIGAFRAANPDPAPVGLLVGPLPRQEFGSGHILVRLISFGLLAAVMAMLALWWQNRAELLSNPTDDDAPGAALATPANRVPESPVPGPEGAGPALALPLPASPGGGAEPGSAPLGALALPPAADRPQGPATANPEPGAAKALTEPAAEAPANPGEVSLTFSGPSWINVRDAAGATVLAGEMRKGDTRVLGGTPPYAFVIGNPGAAQLSVGGRTVDLTGRARGKVARFKFDPRNPE